MSSNERKPMKNDLIQALTETFEGHAQETENGVEYWLARDLQHLLGYSEWRNFLSAISKAKTACEGSGQAVENHFVDINKMAPDGSPTILPTSAKWSNSAPLLKKRAQGWRISGPERA